jgi:hypothetical protein
MAKTRLPPDLARSLSYLRKQYSVSEQDLVALAKTLHKHDVQPEETWEEMTVRYLRNRQGRFTKRKRKHR